jgi:hypothetical protein
MFLNGVDGERDSVVRGEILNDKIFEFRDLKIGFRVNK